MKKKLSLILVAMLLGVASLSARPGYSKPVDVFQPDGSTVTLLMHGDEFLSFMTTVDGYTVIKKVRTATTVMPRRELTAI